MFVFEEIYAAYRRCRRYKRNTVNALRFEVDQIENICDLERSLNDRTYRPGRTVCFLTSSPKLREVFAADFKDRVVHHLLVPVLEEIFEPLFIHDSYSARKGKGIHAALRRVQKFCRSKQFYLQLDIHNFFYSIDKEKLYALIEKQVKRLFLIRSPKTSMTQEEVLWLVRTIIFHDVSIHAIIKGAYPAETMPAHKTFL